MSTREEIRRIQGWKPHESEQAGDTAIPSKVMAEHEIVGPVDEGQGRPRSWRYGGARTQAVAHRRLDGGWLVGIFF